MSGDDRSAAADGSVAAERTLVLTVPDWSAVAAAAEHGLDADTPVVVLHAGKVIAADAMARSAGVVLGANKRAAQLRCPAAAVVVWDEEVDNRRFSDGVSALEDLVARFTLLSPGTLAIPLGSLRHGYADEATAVETLISALVAATAWEFFPGIADTVFAAVLAARQARRIETGRTTQFLAVQPVRALEIAGAEYAELIDVLWHLGLRTLGDFAALSPADVTARFGDRGRAAHALASGRGRTPLTDHLRHDGFSVELSLDEPTTRSDTLGFHTRALGASLLERVRRHSLVCTQITIELDAVGGRSSQRTWRIEDMDENTIADRLRWQSEGWLSGQAGAGRRTRPARQPDPDSQVAGAPDPEDFSEQGVILIRLTAAEVTTAIGASKSLFDENTGQITHALERLQGLFGADAVLVPKLQGGWDPAETNLWTPWQQQAAPVRNPVAPWPGALAAPRPTTVENLPVDVLAADGSSVGARPSGLDAEPCTIRYPSGQQERIVDHSGSWPVESGWWDPDTAVYRTRLQIVTESGQALLLSKEHGRWHLTGRYR